MNTPALLGAITGALAITFVLSRLFMRIAKRWVGGFTLIAVAHGATAVIANVLSAFGNANGGPLDWSSSPFYLGAQAIWLIMDLVRATVASRKTDGARP